MDKNTHVAVAMLVFIVLVVSLAPLETHSQTEQTKVSTVPGIYKSAGFAQDGIGDPDKLDPGFYALVQKLMEQVQDENLLESTFAPQSERKAQKLTKQTQDENLQSPTTHHDVIITVNKYDRDGTDFSETNKDAVVKILKDIGARDIKAADLLSFVTASVPVNRILEVSGHGQVYRMGDGQAQMTPTIDEMRLTIGATPDDLRRPDGTTVEGSGVTVGVVDSGINHPNWINDSVIGRVLCTDHRCSPAQASGVTAPDIGNLQTSHGTRVAMVIAGSGLADNNGIAPGVDILDAGIKRHGGGTSPNVASGSHAFEWLLEMGADVSNLSYSAGRCHEVNFDTTPQLLTGEAVDLGMPVVISAGNDGAIHNGHAVVPVYKSVSELACAHNVITVGGIDDRNPDDVGMYILSSRGPASHNVGGTIHPILKPEVVAPAYKLDIPSFVANSTTAPNSGTSFSAPAVTAVVALALQERDMEPATVKAAVLLGANWTGPVPCTSVQYEENHPTDNCSHARQPTDWNTANNADSLGIINNVGFGILDAGRTLDYVTGASGRHLVEGSLHSNSDADAYQFEVHDTENPVKVILSWTADPFYDGYRSSGGDYYFADLGFTVDCPGMNTISAQSAYQSNEFAVFVPAEAGTCTVAVTGTDIDTPRRSEQNYALASTLPFSSRDDTFVMVWNTIAQNESIIIPAGGAADTYSVEWGDGTVSANVAGDQTHAYDSAGTHAVSISGDFTRINLGDDANNAAKLHSIVQWGDTRWQSMESAFNGASNMTYSATDSPDLSGVTYMISMFSGASSFNSDLSDWNVSSVTDMSGMFSGASSFNSDLSDWNVSSVTDMSGMFSGASSFNSDLSDWNVSSVTDMSGMFDGADSFAQNLGTWYIVLDDTPARAGNATIAVGSIAAQNAYLDGQNPSYGMGIGGDSGYFETDGSTLVLNAGSGLPESRTYAVNITSTGGFGANNSRTVEVVINNPPIVDAGVNQDITEGLIVSLSGTASDADQGDSLTYEWSHDGSVAITLDDPSSPSTWFEAPGVHSDTTVTLTLTVHDGVTSSDDTVEVTILDTGNAPFVTTWQTTSANEVITIPVGGGASGAYTVDWGDGTVSANVTGDQMHIYDDAGTYTVSISGNFTRINLYQDRNNAEKLQSIEQWGDIKWESMSRAFSNAANMVSNASDTPDLASVTDMSYMFMYASSFNSDLSSWDVSSVTNMSHMLAVTPFNSDLSSWDVSSVTDMSMMFFAASSFNSDLSSWNVSNVDTIDRMFYGASSFNSDLSDWNVSHVDNMLWMFHGASSFNSDLSDWNVSSVTNMHGIFKDASSFNSDLSSWDVSSVEYMNGMFHGASSFDGDLSSWDVSSVRFMGGMFLDASSFNSDLSSWDVSNVYGMNVMFHDASSFNSDLSSWNVSNVGRMHQMFRGASSFDADLSDWDVSYVTNMDRMFHDASSFNSDLSSWDVSNVDNMSDMFRGASSFNSDLSSWDVSNVDNMSDMFRGASSFNGNISSWDVSNVDNMSDMFRGASSFNGNISSWDVSNVDNMSDMFHDASSFNSDLSSWDVSNVDTMIDMFSGASSFNSDLSSWDVSNVDTMIAMFHDASSFNSDLSDWDVSNVVNMAAMFDGASSFNGNISSWNVSSARHMGAMFKASSFNGNISSWDVSNVGAMSNMFLGASSFNSDLSDWDVSSVKSMGGMFMLASSFNGNISSWDVSNVKNMYRMFEGASSFNSDLSDWDVSSVKSMGSMFNGASAFRQNLGNWYIVLNNTTIHVDNTPGVVGHMSAQNLVLGRQNPKYNIGDGEDFDSFNITDSSVLNMIVSPDKPGYTVNITSTGDFGTSNYRIYNVTVTGIDTTSPTVTSIERHDPTSENTDSQTLIYRVTFSENVTGVHSADFALSPGSTGAGSITGLTGSGYIYNVTVSATQDGTYNLDLVSSGHGITDESSNPLVDTTSTGVDHTYTVSTIPADTTAPTISSIERFSPSGTTTSSQTLIYRVTFSENVTGVHSADFALSPGSTGAGSITGLTGSGYIYNVTVSATQDGTYNLDLVSSGHGITANQATLWLTPPPPGSTTPTRSAPFLQTPPPPRSRR